MTKNIKPVLFRGIGGCIALVVTALHFVACTPVALTTELPQTSQENEKTKSPPNILLIMADDLGYSDIGAFGSEIRTPNLDALAAGGISFTHFRVNMLCTPTRAMLLTGLDNHAVGIGTMSEVFTDETRGQPGYETYLHPHVETLGQQMQAGGYRTLMAGKWDLGGRGNPELWPVRRGFDRSYVLIEGSGSHFTRRSALPELDSVTYVLDDQEVELPEDFYSSKDYADKIIEFTGSSHENEQPFFAYLSFTAPHYPLEAPDEYIAANKGRYDGGYDAIRQQRLRRQKELGIIDPALASAPPHPLWPQWNELSDEMRALETRRMEIYAGMVEAMDFHIGRVIDHLKLTGQWDNTIVLFLSDNGPEGGNPLDWGGQEWFDWAEANYDLSLENMGRRNSYVWQSPGWAEVSATPFRLWKSFPTEGGIRSPLIVHGPGVVKSGQLSDAGAHILDLMPTLLDIAGISLVDARSDSGRTLMPVLSGAAPEVRQQGDYLALEILARRAVIRDDWKIAWINEPWGPQGRWALFDLSTDPTEQNDLAAVRPDVLVGMVEFWDRYVRENGVIPIEVMPMGYTNSFSHYEWLPPSMRTSEQGDQKK